jgi:hypothetical protein
VLFGTVKRCWIGDGWHRVMAARQLGRTEIEADLREGDRRDALKYALGANAANGLRRTNDDKRRCVELALVAFGGLSSRSIADMCGVSHPFVMKVKPVQVVTVTTSTVTGADGKQYQASRKPAPVKDEDDDDDGETEHEQEEVTHEKHRDPTDTTVEVSDDEVDTPTLYQLKRFWRQATKQEKTQFKEWIQ